VAFVLDPSAALPWCFTDEATPLTEKLLTRAEAGEDIYVVSHWPLEVLNALTRAARRGRTDEPTNNLFLNALLSYNIHVIALSIEDQWTECHPLILKHRLSAYDAAYLALAKRLQIPLATLDEQLRLAAEAEGLLLSA